MDASMVVVGGGIGGLAAAVAGARAGWSVRLLEQASAFGEVGAGIQLGPNVVRVLHSWGLEPALRAVAAYPAQLEVRSALTAKLLGVLLLGERCQAHYGAPYATIARADLHKLLLQAALAQGVAPQLATAVARVEAGANGIDLHTEAGNTLHTPLLLGADGLWSRVRQQVLPPGLGQTPRATGHVAFRALVPQSSLPAALRSQVITAWLGPRFHVVQYPVRGGELLNVVAIVQGQLEGDPTSWDNRANAAELRTLLANAQAPLLDLIHTIADWRLWHLYDRPPMASAAEQAQGRIALLGDAAHPMRPYMAQGAGMAIEDAQQLAQSLSALPSDVPAALAHYAAKRWQRNARVQARGVRNGQIFHLKGPLRVARDVSMQQLGPALLDVPWLYGYRA
ncbi:MAG: FAD-dependent monooxygenase [Rhodoferax sp.]|nr:FAD-dependent monooxygenase [Rhodoferax sp.]